MVVVVVVVQPSEQQAAGTNRLAMYDFLLNIANRHTPGPILSVFPAQIVHSELKSVHPGFPVAFIF